jgi:archaellum component FlaC
VSEVEFKEIESLLYEYGEIAGKIKKLRDELQDELESRKDILNLLKANVITDAPRVSGGVSDPVYQAVSRAVDVFAGHIERLRLEIEGLNKKRDFVEELLKGLAWTERKIVELRYFQGHDWEVVARKSNYSKSQCLRIKNAIIEKIAI